MIRKIIAAILIILGSIVMMYPRAITEYNKYVFQEQNEEYVNNLSVLTSEELRNNIEEIIRYNEKINKDYYEFNYLSSDPFVNTSIEKKELSFMDKNDAFAYIVIPKLNETLPIHLGATDDNLYEGVANITGTSLPIGGVDNHSVIAGHRGYYKALLFRHIDKLEKGDRFYIYVYGKKLSYMVEEIKIVTPTELDVLNVVKGKDMVSLLSCYPFPYMSHRIVVQGVRVPNDSYSLEIDKIHENIEYKTDLNSKMVEEIWKEFVPETSYKETEEVVVNEEVVADKEKVSANKELPEIRRIRRINYLIILACIGIISAMLIVIFKEVKKKLSK